MVLECEDEEELLQWNIKAEEAGFTTVKVEEPDINNRPTAVLICPEPGVSKLVRQLPTLSAGDSRQQAISASKQDIENAKAEGWASYAKGDGIKHYLLGWQRDTDTHLEDEPDHEHTNLCDKRNDTCWVESARFHNYRSAYETFTRWGNVDMVTVRENPYSKELVYG